jgi:hypothetical protein
MPPLPWLASSRLTSVGVQRPSTRCRAHAPHFHAQALPALRRLALADVQVARARAGGGEEEPGSQQNGEAGGAAWARLEHLALLRVQPLFPLAHRSLGARGARLRSLELLHCEGLCAHDRPLLMDCLCAPRGRGGGVPLRVLIGVPHGAEPFLGGGGGGDGCARRAWGNADRSVLLEVAAPRPPPRCSGGVGRRGRAGGRRQRQQQRRRRARE